jgi:uncharacterized RDD family membrane protein YckC
MSRWYYVDGDQAAGPVDDAALRQLALDGRVRPGSLVTPVGSTRWYTLSEFEDRLSLQRNIIGDYGTVPGPFNQPRGFAPRTSASGEAEVSAVAEAGSGGVSAAPVAGWGRRMLAALADLVLFIAVVVGIGWLIGGISIVHETQRDTLRVGGRGLVLAAGLALLYFGLLVGATGWTLGKLLLGFRVVDVSDGLPVGVARGVLRILLVAALAAPCGVPLVVDALWPLIDRRQRTLHDKALGTVAVRTRPARGRRAEGSSQRVNGRRATQPNSASGSPWS